MAVSCKATCMSMKVRSQFLLVTDLLMGCGWVEGLLLTVSKHFIFFYHFFTCRNLSKPIAVQYKEKEDRYVDTYKVGLVFRHILVNENSSLIL